MREPNWQVVEPVGAADGVGGLVLPGLVVDDDLPVQHGGSGLARSTSGSGSGSVGEQYVAAFERPHCYQLHLDAARGGKDSHSGSEDGGADHQAQLVDQTSPDKGSDPCRAGRAERDPSSDVPP